MRRRSGPMRQRSAVLARTGAPLPSYSAPPCRLGELGNRLRRRPFKELRTTNVDRIKLKCRSPRIAVRFMDGEAVFTHCPSAPGKPLNLGRALRVAIAMYRSRQEVQRRLGFCEYDRAIPVTAIFHVRCFETDA